MDCVFTDEVLDFWFVIFPHRETNLKVKQALTVTGDMGDNLEALAAFNGEEKDRKKNRISFCS